jgi:hypothetical protein
MINQPSQTTWYKHHRLPPLQKSARTGHPITFVAHGRSKAWATRPKEKTHPGPPAPARIRLPASASADSEGRCTLPLERKRQALRSAVGSVVFTRKRQGT